MYVDPMLYAAEELANAVIIQSAIDYRQAMKDLWLCPRDAKAKYICEQGLYGEVTIETPEGLMLISTYGIYLDKVTDMEYRAQLLEILEPKQHALEKAEFGFAFGEIL